MEWFSKTQTQAQKHSYTQEQSQLNENTNSKILKLYLQVLIMGWLISYQFLTNLVILAVWKPKKPLSYQHPKYKYKKEERGGSNLTLIEKVYIQLRPSGWFTISYTVLVLPKSVYGRNGFRYSKSQFINTWSVTKPSFQHRTPP